MRLLLDSHVLLWWSDAVPSRLIDEARKKIGRAASIFVSVATIWELEIKVRAGKLELTNLDWELPAQRSVTIIAIERDDALAAARLPLLHRDPFDRMLVAQAIRRDLTLMTADQSLAGYGVALLPA